MSLRVRAGHLAFNVLVALDQLANAVAGGQPRDTISARAYRAQQNGRAWGCLLCRALDRIQKDHCAKAARKEAGDARPL